MEGGQGGLSGAQWPKGLSEDEVRKIAREEAANALAALAEEVANSPNPNRNLDKRDFCQSAELAERKIRPSDDV